MMPSNPCLRQRGFTLVEIAVVVLIVGILSLLATFVIGTIKDRTARSLLENNLRQLYQAKEYYFTETGDTKPVSAKTLADQNYLRRSQLYNLYQHGAMETHMGWRYDESFYPGDPVAAKLIPNGGAVTSPRETIFYPDAPSNGGLNRAGQAVAAAFATRTQPPQITAPPAQPPALKEDGSHTFTKNQLLAMVGIKGTTQNPVSITKVEIDPNKGTVTKGPGGTWIFTPAPNFHGTNIPLTVGVGNQNGVTEAKTKLTVTPVTDPPRPAVSPQAEQHVITFGQDGTGALLTAGTLQTNGPITQLATEFTVIGGQQVTTQGDHGATFVSYGTPTDSNEFYVWNPSDLTVRIHGREYPTGIDTTADANSHRYSFLWESSTGTVEAYVDGQLRKRIENVGKGYQIPSGGKLVLAQDQDSFGGGFSPADAFHGQFFNAAVASGPVDRAQLAQAPLAEILQGQPQLLIDIQAHGDRFVDTTGRHQINQQGSISSASVMVDTSLATAIPGSTLHLNLNAGQPVDPGDQVVSSVLSGLVTGTVVQDGRGNTHRVTSERERIDVSNWDLGSVTAQPPVTHRGRLQIQLESTTKGPDGQTATASSTATVRLG